MNKLTYMMWWGKSYIISTMLALPILSSAETLVVPDDYPSIQSAVNLCQNGDTVFVKSGIYYEHVNATFKDGLCLTGEDKNTTIIDGNGTSEHIVFFNVGSGIFKNFTVRNGGGNLKSAIFVSQADISIENNIITGNIQGIDVSSYSNAMIRNNIIFNNSPGISGGVIRFETHSTGYVINNLIYNNNGPAIRGNPKIIANNTVVNNDRYSAFIRYLSDTLILTNNIFSGSSYGIYILGDISNPLPLVKISYNNVWDNDSADYWVAYGTIENWQSLAFTPQPGTGENHSDPLFYNPQGGNFYPQNSSPCVNAGTPDTSGLLLPVCDILGHPRIHGNRIDMGAIENMQVQGISDWNGRDAAKNLFELFPNPCSGSCQIGMKHGRPGEKVRIAVTDAIGRVVFLKNYIFSNEEKLQVDLPDHSPGVYLVTIGTPGFLQTKQLVIK